MLNVSVNDINDLNKLKIFSEADLEEFTIEELTRIGSHKFNDELIIFPQWLIDVCKVGTKLTSINGETLVKGILYNQILYHH